MVTPIPAPSLAPRLRLEDCPLPPYRYVPGLNPHPFRHPDGHAYTDGSAPAEDPTQLPWLWRRGCDLFDHRYLWEAHEAWEACWHHTPAGPRRELQQGLIQAAAARLKLHMGHRRPAARLQRIALQRLDTVLQGPDAIVDGVDVAATAHALQAGFAAGRWPTIVGGLSLIHI